jgi:prepilin-type N-terminal cleavage/methylation domain-containing protein
MNTRDGGVRRAFTLVELLIVISIFLLLLLIAVPAFSSMLYSSEQSLAENAMRGGIAAARDAAAKGRQGEDAAAVFFYDSSTRRTSIVACVRVGTMEDQTSILQPPPGGNSVVREVFVPVSGYEPVQLPRGWAVRGYAIPGTIDSDWYGDSIAYNPSVQQQGHWVFPETDFFDYDVADDGQSRQTFMVRFEGGTGALKPADLEPVLVLSPSPSEAFRTGLFQTYRLDNAPDKVRVVRAILSAPPLALTAVQRRQLLGDESSDTVLAKPVRQLGLCNEGKLASALARAGGSTVRLDRDTGSLYQNTTDPEFVTDFASIANPLQTLTALMELRVQSNGTPSETIDSSARIFTIHRYLGSLQEITGTQNGEGVSQ